MRYFIFILAFVSNSVVQSKPTKSHKFHNNDPMQMEDLFEGDIMFPDNPAYANVQFSYRPNQILFNNFNLFYFLGKKCWYCK